MCWGSVVRCHPLEFTVSPSSLISSNIGRPGVEEKHEHEKLKRKLYQDICSRISELCSLSCPDFQATVVLGHKE